MITIIPPGKITISKPVVDPGHFSSAKAIQAWFASFSRSSEREATLIVNEPLQIIGSFRESFHFVLAAGGLVGKGKKHLFIFKNGIWDLPKGKVEPGETTRDAALREVQEECGLKDLNIVKKLDSTYHFYCSPYPETKGEWIFKETVWYEMIYKGDYEGCPETKENITVVQWFDSKELTSVLENTYPNLKPLVLHCADQF